MDSSTLTLWTGSFQFKEHPVCFYILPCFKENPIFYAYSVGLDLTSSSAASDLGPHCLPVSPLWDARNKWVNKQYLIYLKYWHTLSIYHSCPKI